jgi:hypothetical protein
MNVRRAAPDARVRGSHGSGRLVVAHIGFRTQRRTLANRGRPIERVRTQSRRWCGTRGIALRRQPNGRAYVRRSVCRARRRIAGGVLSPGPTGDTHRPHAGAAAGITLADHAARTITAWPRSEFGKAVRYMLGRWEGLTRFVEDPCVPVDNNAAEHALCGPVVGRKNHCESRSLRGTQVAALFSTLCETAKLTGVDPHAYVLRAMYAAIAAPGASAACVHGKLSTHCPARASSCARCYAGRDGAATCPCESYRASERESCEPGDSGLLAVAAPPRPATRSASVMTIDAFELLAPTRRTLDASGRDPWVMSQEK